MGVLTDSKDPKQYLKKMKSRDPELNSNWGTICTLVQKQTCSIYAEPKPVGIFWVDIKICTIFAVREPAKPLNNA